MRRGSVLFMALVLSVVLAPMNSVADTVLTGTVTNKQTGSPIGGATVELSDVCVAGAAQATTTTQSDGSYSITAPDDFSGCLIVGKTGYNSVSEWIDCDDSSCNVSGFPFDGDFEIEPAAPNTVTLSGRVTDAGTGSPIKDAYVAIYQPQRCNIGGADHWAYTSESGVYNISNVPDEFYGCIVVSKLNYADVILSLACNGNWCWTQENPFSKNFQLQRNATTIDGTISLFDLSGNPVTEPEDVLMYLVGSPWGGPEDAVASSISQTGAYSFNLAGHVGQGLFLKMHLLEYAIDAECTVLGCDPDNDQSGPMFYTAGIQEFSSTTVNWEGHQQPNFTVPGRVMSERNNPNDPIFYWYPVTNASIAGFPASYNPSGVTTGADGRFAATVPYGWSGEWNIDEPCKTYTPAVSYPTLWGSPPEVVIHAQHFGVSIGGTVTDPVLGPVEGATVLISDGAPYVTLTTDANGFFQEHFPCGWVGEFHVSHPNYVIEPAVLPFTAPTTSKLDYAWSATNCGLLLSIDSPTGGTYYVNDNMTISTSTACASQCDDVSFELSTSGPNGPWTVIGNDADGEITWTVTGVPSTSCHIRATSFAMHEGELVAVSSDVTNSPFTIKVLGGGGCRGCPPPIVSDDGTPRVTTLHHAVPNPFNPTTTVHFDLSEEADVAISVHDVSGRLIRSSRLAQRAPGRASWTWDGRDERGTAVASGVYFLRFTAGQYTKTIRLVLLK